MDAPVLADQQGLTYISSVRTLNAVLRTCQKQGTIRLGSERESINFISSVQLDDDDDDDDVL